MRAAVEASISSATTAAQRFYNISTEENAAALDAELANLIKLTNSIDPTARLTLKSVHLSELLTYCPILLGASGTSAITRSRLHLFLFNIAFFNVSLREYLAGDQMQICGPVFECLRLSLRDQLGPQNLIDILRLLQVLTYERCLSLGMWTNDLISFLLSEVNREEEPEWMPYCMAILCNLASRSKSVCQRIKKSSSYKVFSHKLLKLLAHDSRIVVVSALVLVGYLEAKLRDTVFCSRNMPQTFQCVFNVLVIGDCLMTRHIAADLLRRLVVSDAPNVSSVPVITSTGKDLINYSYFERSVQMVAALIVQLDARSEESLKIYDIFLSFCSLLQMRTPTSLAILKCPPKEQRLTTPVLSMCITAQMTFEEAIVPEVPLKAVRLLRYILREAIESGSRVQESVPAELVLRLIEGNIKTPVETGSELVSYQCRRITEGLRLAETVSNDDDMRSDILEVVTAPLCAHIVESQMLSNPIVPYMGRSIAQRTESVPKWSADGVSIVLELLRVLAALKDYSKLHKDQYWKLLKDDRLVPFIAYAIAFGNHELTYDALLLYTHCAQVHAFPTRWLGDLIASCVASSLSEQTSTAKGSSLPRSTSDYRLDGISLDGVVSDGRKTPDARLAANGDSAKQIDELLEMMKHGVDIKDPHVSQLIGVFERKIHILKNRELELEQLLAKKDDSLRQSERLRALYSSQNNDVEVSNLRQLLSDYERRVDELNALVKKINLEKKEQEEAYDSAKKALDEKQMAIDAVTEQMVKLNQENNVLIEENKYEREFSTLTKNRYDELKSKFDQTSLALIEKDKECTRIGKDIVKLKDDLSAKDLDVKSLTERLQKVEEASLEAAKEHESVVKTIRDKLNDREQEVERLSRELAKVMKFKDQMMRMMNEI
ncbi:Protein CIP2A [Toxocara canis]|uniref:Protein CIP2A n=1 Tax=Toxocara canis TaxID=6265 RepID=A0A0B2V247_TOXCA|nr:Protein CIP2A [Toxocara canis]